MASGNIEQLIFRLRNIPSIRVGVLEENAARIHPNSPDGETVGNIALRNHFGAPGCPARPFITYAMDKHRKEIQKASEHLVNKPDLLGALVVGMIQETISDRVPPPNAQITIERKGSDVPLIDSGILRQSITYKVEKK